MWLSNLLSDSSRISHKRIIALGSFVMLCIMVVAKFFKAELDDTLIYTMAAMTGSYSVMTVVDKKLKNDDSNNTVNSNNVASSI